MAPRKKINIYYYAKLHAFVSSQWAIFLNESCQLMQIDSFVPSFEGCCALTDGMTHSCYLVTCIHAGNGVHDDLSFCLKQIYITYRALTARDHPNLHVSDMNNI